MTEGVSRRLFLGKMAAATAASVAYPSHSATLIASTEGISSPLDILRVPDRATAFAGLNHPFALSRSAKSWVTSAGVGSTVESPFFAS